MFNLYGNFRNRTFCDIWEDFDKFYEEYSSSPLKVELGTFGSDLKIKLVYYLLYSRYGNSVIASYDENQFKYKVFTTIFQYGPTWATRLDTQEAIRKLDIEELRRGGKAIYNTALNPSQAPTTASLEELNYINSQNTTNYKKSTIEAYGLLLSLLETDVSEEFINKFKKLFLTVVQPEIPLWYKTEEGEV